MTTSRRLRDTSLGDVLAQCLRARIDGALTLDHDGQRSIVHLRWGMVCAVEGGAPRLGELAVERGLVTAAAIDAVVEVGPTRARIGHRLVTARLLSSRARDALLLEQRAARLDALFCIEDAELCLKPAAPLPAGSAELPPMLSSTVLVGRPRRRARTAGAVDRAHRDALAALDLSAEATASVVRARFRSLLHSLHPDLAHAPGPPREQRLREVLAAWRTLSSSPHR